MDINNISRANAINAYAKNNKPLAKKTEDTTQPAPSYKIELNKEAVSKQKIESAIQNAPEVDNKQRIMELKAQIAENKYDIDPEKIASKMMDAFGI